jgi:hypothetical protein
MSRLRPDRQALADQILAILRDEDGFPMSTGDVAARLPMKLILRQRPLRVDRPRPECWPDDVVDYGDGGPSPCDRCGIWHITPVWRYRQAEDIRSLLNKLDRDGLVEKLSFPDVFPRRDYWRREDTDR